MLLHKFFFQFEALHHGSTARNDKLFELCSGLLKLLQIAFTSHR
jgi:hypothetical protein